MTTELNTDNPPSHSHLPADIRLEMLVGHLADQLTPARGLVTTLRLRSKSTMTRGDLQHLIDMTGSLWMTLNRIKEEATAIRAAVEADTEVVWREVQP